MQGIKPNLIDLRRSKVIAPWTIHVPAEILFRFRVMVRVSL